MIWQTITLDGIPPSKKNSKRIVRRGKRSFLLSSESYLKWEKGASLIMASKLKPVSCCSIGITFWVNGGRSFDLDNKLTSVLDCLVKAKIIKDDSYKVVTSISATYQEHLDETFTMISIGSDE
jgi:Holliday junction resolvase RusA-like endonuclease